MTQIITITPNPAIDISTSVQKLAPFGKMRCASPQYDPGGGGLNVARVVKRLGGRVRAIYPAGGSIGQLLSRLIDQEEVPHLAVPALEETRQDFTVFEETTSHQYRFVLPGPHLAEHEWQRLLDVLLSIDVRPDFVVASGSLPPGVPDDFYGRVAMAATSLGAKAVIDSSGKPLAAALEKGTYLIKPNIREFRELTGAQGDDSALVTAGRDLIARTGVSIIALTMGPHGALLITADRAIRADGIPIKPASVVGAGDSFLGAFVWSLASGQNLETALRYGVAAGSAALLTSGTDLCRSDDVRHLLSSVATRDV